ncbi:MAG TPA: BamA/TamA family outer membrane protein [Puia sp.]|nr:BamA/TamA family outer membrane protein [Puia sp.]
MNHIIIRMAFLFCLPVMFYSCSETSSLEEGQYLYAGAKVKIKADPRLSRKTRNAIKPELEGLLRPKPNGSFLGIKVKLLLYNMAGKPTGKGLRYFIREKLGEPPVIAQYSVMEKNRAVLQNRLENRGFFKDTVILDTIYKGRKLSAVYTAVVGKQYTIRNVVYPTPLDSADTLTKDIHAMYRRSLLKKGDPYDLDVLKNERVRIDTRLKQKGFYYFNPDNLLFRVDSAVGDHKVDISLLVKKSASPEAHNIYRIGEVVVYADYDVHVDTSMDVSSLPKYQGYTIVDPNHMFKPKIFARTLIFKPGDVYNRKDHDLTLNRLISLGVYKFVKIRFDETDTAKRLLNAYYYLTPTERKSIRFEVSGLTQSDNANGGQVSVNWRDRNTFRGAELLTNTAYIGFLRQNLGKGQYTNTFKFGDDISLYLPGIIGPIQFQTNSGFVPKTKFSLGYEYFQQSQEYTLNSFKASAGYVWKESITKEHTLDVFRVNLVNPTHIDSNYQKQLDTNIVLARSLERTFIIGPVYNFNFNSNLRPNRNKNNFYFNGNIDWSSNIIGVATGANVQKDGVQKKIFNVPFSQYIRGEIDFRHYLSFTKTTILASRLTGGVGYAWGNSSTMPFVKEFFAGGANDIRAFRSRALGPGTYYAGNRQNAFVADQPGDIKIEANTEIRFKIVSVFHWAFFADAGNIWTLRYDSSRVGSQFSSNWLNQIGVGVGTGLRLDISILLIRLDLGVPVREPWKPKGSQWVFDTGNTVLNFAIGYPF